MPRSLNPLKLFALFVLALLSGACLPNLELEYSDLAGSWQGEDKDTSWCMEFDDTGRVHYQAVIPKVGEFGQVTGETMQLNMMGSYSLETGGRLLLEIPFMGAIERMPFLLASVSDKKMVYYDGQEAGRTRFVSLRVESCKYFLASPDNVDQP